MGGERRKEKGERGREQKPRSRSLVSGNVHRIRLCRCAGRALRGRGRHAGRRCNSRIAEAIVYSEVTAQLGCTTWIRMGFSVPANASSHSIRLSESSNVDRATLVPDYTMGIDAWRPAVIYKETQPHLVD